MYHTGTGGLSAGAGGVVAAADHDGGRTPGTDGNAKTDRDPGTNVNPKTDGNAKADRDAGADVNPKADVNTKADRDAKADGNTKADRDAKADGGTAGDFSGNRKIAGKCEGIQEHGDAWNPL